MRSGESEANGCMEKKKKKPPREKARALAI